MDYNKQTVYHASGVYKESGGGVIEKLPSLQVKFDGFVYDLIFFCGLIITKQNLKYPVDLGTHTYYANGDRSTLNDYGYLYDYTAINAIRANINSLGLEWGEWTTFCNNNMFSSQAMQPRFWSKYSADDIRNNINFQPAGLRKSDGTYAAFGSSMCLGYGDTGSYYMDIPSNGTPSAGMPISNASLSLRLVLVKP